MSNETVEPEAEEVEMVPVGRVRLPSPEELAEMHSGYFDPETGEEIPMTLTVHDVPIPDGNGGTAYAKADAPGNPSVTTSPLD